MKKANARTVAKVLRNLADFVEQRGQVERADYATRVNSMLDALVAEDAFGTEGQCDPRGDQRNEC